MHTVNQTATKVLTETVTNLPHRRVGILGGTFNPPHLGHLIMAQQVGDQLGLDEVRFMPDAQPPHVDEKKTIAAQDRVNMVQAAIADNPLFRLETAEIKRGGKSYSYDTMKLLKAQHPDTQYYFIIGGDMVDYLHKWYHIDDLLKLVTFVGIKRTGYPTTSRYPVIWVDAPLIDVSSTAIRKKINHGHTVRYLVPDAVAAYIEEHHLYEQND
ncbi:nicotinate-nucleotide adenylyltransferase [Lactiplantibacillus xiangfangensis]|uniref:Probable nicotinate-nucleotide adenylyltransferase n=1 Tax=Lactiplantibacillus xiangfangensis TaxID=942150 RepID=A0A0R2MGJ9_9LACO|nr:nicotinate-nucleotide adenylyltransferase [Lactiplantibacillus xiangfangensis]KRO11250.1 nicotinic acid mononucleotide adenylyltransferase [Lactiplantibacillus xiangfangensis]